MESALSRHEGGFRIEAASADYAFGTWRNVLAVEWKLRTLAADVRNIRTSLTALGREHPGGVFYLAFVCEAATPPDEDARRALAEMLREDAGHLRGGAVVFDGVGFRGAFVRGVATGLVLLARPAFPFEVCSIKDAGALFTRISIARGLAFPRELFAAEMLALRSAFSGVPTSGVHARANEISTPPR